MSIRRRNLGQGILYIFNGNDFIVNSDLPAGEYEKMIALCLEHAGRMRDRREEAGPGKKLKNLKKLKL